MTSPSEFSNINGRTSSPLDSDLSQPLSRRQRLLGLARATRDNYIPRLTGQVTQIASGASRAFATPGSDLYDEQGNVIFPKDASITLFPSYTRQVGDKYYIDIKGWVSCPGLMTRKNRLILSLVRQVTRYNSANSDQAIHQLESDKLKQDMLQDDVSDLESFHSEASKDSNPDQLRNVTSSSSSVQTGPSAFNNEELMKERLASFIARSIPNAALTVVIGSHVVHSEIAEKEVFTDASGNFETTVQTSYLPSVIQVKANSDDTIFSFQDVMFVPGEGIGVISDIDDTVKLTGVIGDKRELMTNLLLKEVTTWSIPPVISWYDNIKKLDNVSFHYVSNSPWQLFSTIEQYFRAVKLPYGSFHLKHYTGNIISSLMEPSSSRKKKSLDKILNDFPEKKFICVGDSGEADLEAYVDLAKSHPGHILSINIRVVEDSLSDVDDNKILNELVRILTTKRRVTSSSATPQPVEIPNLIDLSDDSPVSTPQAEERRAKLPPMIPKKPTNLKGNSLEKKPPLPRRDYLARAHTDSELASKPTVIELTTVELPPLPKRPDAVLHHAKTESDEAFSQHENNLFDNLQNIYDSPNFYELEEMDRKGANWIRRVITSLQDLEGSGTELRLFSDGDQQFFANSTEDLRNLKR